MKRFLSGGLALVCSASTPGSDGFAIARSGYRFAFPRDHGSHPAFRTEWWYFTGHLWSGDGARRFGYQLTFFRQASPPSPWKGSQSWRSDQLHLAHAALTDEAGKRFLMDERLDRAGLLAGAAEDHLEVFQQDWEAAQDPSGQIRLHLSLKGAALDLTLEPTTPPVIFGKDGLSRKGSDPGAASHYLTFPRLKSQGRLRLPEGATLAVQGHSWMDHEFSSSQLAQDQVGWDWAGMQFRDGRSWMVYRLRRKDGSQDPFSILTEVDAAGHIQRSTQTFSLIPKASWRSPSSGTSYPLPLVLKAWGEELTLMPILPDQELQTGRSTGITYWEGACRILGSSGLDLGDAYVELTGYAHSLKGRF